jgi:enamine deaminase RidA (YjgF/YER057c/UK114 family)
MMRLIDPHTDFPVSDAVFFAGYVFQTELKGIPKGATEPVSGGAAAELREIFSQLDHKLADVGIDKLYIGCVKLYLQDLDRDLEDVDTVYAEYFGSHSPSRGVYGCDLPGAILIEASFVASVPVYE